MKVKDGAAEGEIALDEDQELLFQVTGDTMATLDNSCASLAELLNTAKKNKGLDQCKVCYHKLTQNPDQSWTLLKVLRLRMA